MQIYEVMEANIYPEYHT